MQLTQLRLWQDKAFMFYPYWMWEDFLAGMYKQTPKQDLESMVAAAVNCLASTEDCEKYMRMAVDKWPIASIENLRDSTKNRRPWLGRACCCVSLGIREDAVRVAWWNLSEFQRENANALADTILKEWDMALDA